MEPSSHVVVGSPDQLPDESYIERLFPKCPPKQQTGAPRRQLGSGSLRLNGSHVQPQHHQQQQQQQQHHRNPNQQQRLQQQEQQPLSTRRRNRSKVHQHSRRELEARRNKNRSNDNKDINNNNNNSYKIKHIQQQQQQQHSTDSSDNEPAGGKKSALKRSSSTNEPALLTGRHAMVEPNTTSTSQLAGTASTSSLVDTSISNRNSLQTYRGVGKKTSKYTASQNLQQQLQRSQSGQPIAGHMNPGFKASNHLIDPASIEDSINSSLRDSSVADTSGRTNGGKSPALQQISSTNEKCSPTVPKAQLDISQASTQSLILDTDKGVCRTSRGVVFGKLIDKIDVTNSILGQSMGTSTTNGLTETVPVFTQTRTSSSPPSSSTNQRTADTTLHKTTLDTDADNELATNIFHEDKLLTNVNTESTIILHSPRKTIVDEQANAVESKDQDRYINLFVYDNPPPPPPSNCTSRIADTNIIDTIGQANLVVDKSLESTIRQHPDILEETSQTQQPRTTTRQLLIDDEEENTIRNDTSTEELCNVTEPSEEIKYSEQNIKIKRTENESISSKRYNSSTSETATPTLTSTTDPIPTRGHSSHHRSIGTLQPVDEKAELSIEESSFDRDNLEDQKAADEAHLLDSSSDKSAMQTSNNNNGPHAIKKAFVPPGFPQRVKPSGGTSNATREPLINRQSSPPISPTSVSSQVHLADGDPSRRPNSQLNKKALPLKIASTETDEQPTDTQPKDKNDLNVSRNQATLEDACNPSNGKASRRPDSHGRQMPSISEDITESGYDQRIQNVEINDVKVERELSYALDRVTLNKQPSSNSSLDEPLSGELSQQQQPNSQIDVVNDQIQKISALQNSNQAQEYAPTTGNTATSLRHHLLPNETSHYSVIRSNNNVNPIGSVSGCSVIKTPTRSSSIQFNTLSDGESGPDESPSQRHVPNLNIAMPPAGSPSANKKSEYRGASTTGSVQNSTPSSKLDDDLPPMTKTALIFPRLDEGLSSEAESCEDEVEEDDDRAMEADVDADDDEDEDEDEELDDDDSKSPTESIVRGSQALQSSVDSFIRQQQISRTQNRLIGSLQPQQQHLGGSILNSTATDPSELYPPKGSTTNYAGYLGQDTADPSDMKSTNAYSSQNGQSNYWMGLSNQQQQQQQQPSSVISSQLSPSNQQFAIQRSHQNASSNSNNSIGGGTPRGTSGSYNREEAKVANRLSSDTDNETDRLLGPQRADQLQKISSNDVGGNNDIHSTNSYSRQSANSREVLIEGVLFNVKYLGSTHTDCEGRGEKEDRIQQAELAVHEVKFRNGESQTATEVQLFVSTEKIMVLDEKHRKIMMDHSLRTISYIADIGDAIVLIVRKKSASIDATNELSRPISKISCHVFESNESHTITKSISQAFQVAYTELLKANGGNPDGGNYLPKELDYQEVLNSQEMSTAELEMFSRKDNQREVIVPKKAGEILGLSIVESGWGSVLPTAVIASLKQDGPAYRCKKLSVGDQILSINGISLVGLSLLECQAILRKTKQQRVARLSVVPCPITVEVKIKRPDTKYQLGFSVQNGVICSLLRGGIAERGGVRVGHRIMSINGTTVVGVPHEKIVTLLASSVGEIRMKTCLTSLYRHMLGEEKAVFL